MQGLTEALAAVLNATQEMGGYVWSKTALDAYANFVQESAIKKSFCQSL